MGTKADKKRQHFNKESFEAELKLWFSHYLKNNYYKEMIEPNEDLLVELNKKKNKTIEDWIEIRRLHKFMQQNERLITVLWDDFDSDVPSEIIIVEPNDKYRFAAYLHEFECGYDIDHCGWRYEEDRNGAEHIDYLEEADKFERRGGNFAILIRLFEDFFVNNINNQSQIKKELGIINVPGLD